MYLSMHTSCQSCHKGQSSTGHTGPNALGQDQQAVGPNAGGQVYKKTTTGLRSSHVKVLECELYMLTRLAKATAMHLLSSLSMLTTVSARVFPLRQL